MENKKSNIIPFSTTNYSSYNAETEKMDNVIGERIAQALSDNGFSKKAFCEVLKAYGEEIVIGLHGESMGAASVMNSLKYDLDIDFVVDDCGYNSLEKLICYKLKSMRLPRIMLKGCNLILKRKYKYCFNDVIPIESVSKTKIPILIVHGKKDTMVPYYHAEEIYERNKDHAYLYSLEGVEHAKMFETDIDEYERVLIDFLKKYLLNLWYLVL